MIKNPQTKVIPCLFRTVLVGLVSYLIIVTTARAEDQNAPTRIKPTVVTGSLIPTAETVGPAPVETITAADLEKTGAQDVLTALKTRSVAFSGNGNIGHALNNGGYGEAYLALRNLPTLLLIDGRRLNISPFSTFVGTYSADLNTIPIAMIDRVEVLKDGASTIYGSDAIGGVVNIITKKNFSGVQLDAHYGFGLDKGKYNEDRFSAVAGFSKDGTRLVAGAQYYYADPIFASDRKIASLSAVELGRAGLNAPSYFSPSYPGRVGTFLLAGSPLATGAPGYNPTLTAPPVFPGQVFSGATAVQDYNAYAVAHGYVDPTGNGLGPYIPITSTPASQALGGSSWHPKHHHARSRVPPAPGSAQRIRQRGAGHIRRSFNGLRPASVF